MWRSPYAVAAAMRLGDKEQCSQQQGTYSHQGGCSQPLVDRGQAH